MKNQKKIHAPSALMLQLQDCNVQFTQKSFLNSDPISLVHRYTDARDQELVAFLCATFAFGNVKAIISFCERLIFTLGEKPYEGLVSKKWIFDESQVGVYRWVKQADMKHLLSILRQIYLEFGSLENYFLSFGATAIWERRVELFVMDIRLRLFSGHKKTRGLAFLIPDPHAQNALKRMHLFLRWMVRDEYPDLHLWKNCSKADLWVPLDTHIASLSYLLGFIQKEQNNRKAARQITTALKSLNPKDPTWVDFALTRLGILKRCQKKHVSNICSECPIQMACRFGHA